MNTLFASIASSRNWQRIREIALFMAVGILNTVIDFVVLNLLIALTQYRSGPLLLVFNSISFLAATTNSYIWNGRVTFRVKAQGGSWRFIRFVALNAVGLGINSTTVWLMTPFMVAHFPLIVAINVSKALATILSLSWNYVTFKRWIFRAEPAEASMDQQHEQELRFYHMAPGAKNPNTYERIPWDG